MSVPARSVQPELASDGTVLLTVVIGLAGATSALVGVWWLGMAGLVWSGGQLWASSSWDDEADLAIGIGTAFCALGALLCVAATVFALIRARRRDRRRSIVVTAFAVPAAAIVLVLLAATVLMGKGGAHLIPLEQIAGTAA